MENRDEVIRVLDGFHHSLGEYRILHSRYQEEPQAELILEILHKFKSMSETDLARYMDTDIQWLRPSLGVLEWLLLIAHRNSCNEVIWYIDYTEIFDTLRRGLDLGTLVKRNI